MTCIVGYVTQEKKILIGADSIGVAGTEYSVRKDFKVFTNSNGWAVGCTHSFRMAQLLQYEMKWPLIHTENVSFGFMVREVVPIVRDLFKTHGFIEIDKSVERGGLFVVGAQGKLYTIQSDFQVAEDDCPYVSVGSGSPYALGSLHTTQRLPISTRDKIVMALDAAVANCTTVCKPYNFVEV